MVRSFRSRLFATAVATILFGAPFVIGAPAREEAAVDELPSRVAGHRPLRANPDSTPVSADPAQSFKPDAAYGTVPAFEVVPRDDALSFYPCESCHGMLPVNTERRTLYAPHPGTLDHGAGRIWCLDCHAAEGRNSLGTFAGEKVSFNESYLVCGQCHYQPQKDWLFGAHGKRVGNWQGERQLYGCAHCHDPHSPAVRPRQPEGPPPLRHGLPAQEFDHGAEHTVTRSWEEEDE